MKMKNYLQIVMCVVFMLTSLNLSAQLGGLNKLKKKVQTVTKEQTKTSSGSTTTTTNQASSASSSNGVEQQQTKTAEVYQPTAEALAADPQAASDVFLPGHTRTIRDMHKFYANLSPSGDKWLYTPYYNYPLFYIMHEEDSKSESRITALFYKIMTAAVTREDETDAAVLPDYYPVKAKGIDGYMPIIEMVINAYTAAYIADPMSPRTYSYLANLYALENSEIRPYVEYYLEDKTEGIINKEKKMYMIMTPHYTRLSQGRRISDAYDLYKRYYPLEGAKTYFDEMVKKMDEYVAAKNWIEAAIAYPRVLAAFDLMKRNKDYQANRADEIFEAEITEKRADFFKWSQKAKFETMPARPMPSTAKMDASIYQQALAGAKEAYGDTLVDVIFLDGSWNAMKHHEWPYNTIGRKTKIGIIYKPDDIKRDCYVMDYRELMQMGSDGSYSGGMIQTPIGQFSYVIDYKP